MCTVPSEELLFCSDLNIPLSTPSPHPLLSPPLYLAMMSSLIVRSDHIRTPPCLTSKKPADSVISQISDLVNIINLQLSSHFSPHVLPCLCLFLSLSLSGLHPLQNSYCPGQRGDRLLLLEDDCLHRDQDREWIPTSN